VSGEPAFVTPMSVPAALNALRRDGSLALAGGTSVGLLLGQALIEPSVLVWLRRIAALREVSHDGNTLRVGAMVTLRDLSLHPTVRTLLPALAQAAGTVGNARVRSAATLGGALAHADPRQDVPPVLAALGSTAEITGQDGVRTTPVAQLATGLMQTVVGAGELITAVRIPTAPRVRCVYLRFTPGSVADYPTVAVAAGARRAPDGSLASVSLALAGVHRTVLMVPEAAGLVGHRMPPAEVLAAVAAAAADRAEPVTDRLGSASYKRAMADVWSRRALSACLAGDGQSVDGDTRAHRTA
jgi:aerobic carbon-monoxide dehydrogenase medium subunit